MSGNSDQIRGKLSTKIVNTMLAIILVLGLSPLSKASASVVNDSAKQSAEQAQQVATESADDADGSAVDAAAGTGSAAGGSANAGGNASASAAGSANGANVSASTPESVSANSVTGGGASGAVTQNDSAANSAAPQNGNGVAVQSGEYNPDAAPIMFNEGVTVNLFKDDDHNQPLGEDDEITTDDPLYGQLEVTFTQNQRPTKEHPNVSYQFPSNIKITPQTMDLVDNGVVVGKTIIDENGLVTLKYNEAYFSGNKEVNDASFKFNFKMESEPKGDNDSISIIFPGTGTTTVVKTKDGDADVSKFGGDISKSWEGPIFNADDGTYTWTVKVSPKSFATNVNVFDEIGSNLEFVEGSFTMIDSNGASTGASCDAKITSPTTAEIGLGDLPKGDYYLQYKTKVKSLPTEDGVAVSGNSDKATVKWGSKQDHSKEPWVPGPAETKYSMVSKSSSGTNDRIKWVVELNNGSLLADMGGYSFNDVFADQELLGDEVTIVGADGKTIVPNNLSKSDGSLSFVLPEDAGKQKITVTYYTKMKDTSSKDAVSNTATVTPSDPSHGPEGSGSASYTPSDKDSYITKELTSSIDSETYDGKASWQSTIDFGAMSKTTDPTSIVFTDKFSSLPSGTRVSLDGDVIVSASSDSLVAGDDYDIQTASDQGSNGELIRIQFKGSQKIKDLIGTSGAKVTISYSTVSSQVDGTYPAGNYVNQSFIKTSKVDKSAGAQYTITHEATPPAVKKNGKDATWDADYSWADGSKGAWISDWTVYVNGSGEPGSAVMDLKGKKVTVTDSLPSGSEIVSGSTKFKLMDKGGYNGSNQEEVVPSIADGVATFTIPTANAQYTWKEPMGTQVSVVLTYQTAFKATAEQVGIDDLKLANKAQASTEDFTFPEGSGESKVDTRVLTKNGSQDYKSSTAEYSIEVNPNKMNLNPGGSTVTLVDDMDANCKFAGDLQVFDADGNVLDASSWSKRFENVSENGSTHTRLTLTLPDERHLKVTYKVTPLGEWKSTVELTNTCSLNGINGSTTPFKKGFTVWNASSETSSTSYGISVNKYDATMTNRLQGAVFGLYRVSFDASGAPQLSLEKTETTDSSGVAKFGDKADGLGSNTLFAFKELSAPEGFKVTNEDPTYFIIKGTDLNAFDAALNEARSHGINPETSNVSFDVFDDELDNVTGSIALSVQKKVNDNDPADDASFDFQLSSLTVGAPMPASGGEKVTTVGKDAKSFGSITFDKPGTYKYIIEETSPAPDDGNVWTMAKPVYAQVTVDNATDGSRVLPTSVKYYSDEACEHEVSDSVVVFNNAFKAPDSVTAQLKIHKAVEVAEGSNLNPDEEFTFDLYEATEQGDKTDKKIGDTIFVKKDGDGVFDLPAFTAAGTYNYVIHESGHDTNGWTPAPDVKVQVVVGKSGDGTRFEVKSITYNGKADECASFVDKYTPATGAFSIDIQKTVNDSLENGIAKGYTFSATATGGNADQAPNLESVATGDDGKASFAGSLKESDMGKTYQYVISETSEQKTGWTNAPSQMVEVKVSDHRNADGKIDATISYPENTNCFTFNNTYTAKGSATLSVVKQVNGESPADGQTFDFELSRDGEDAGSANAPLPQQSTATTNGSTPASFGAIEFSKDDIGKTYRYVITETSSLGDGWTKADPVEATVSVGVPSSDNLAIIPVSVSYGENNAASKDGAALFNNTYREVGGSFSLALKKSVEGKTLDRSFDFAVEAVGENAGNAPVLERPVVSSDEKTGEASFGTAKLTAGNKGKTYTYKISETSSLGTGWTKAADVYATVVVSDSLNNDGDCWATVSYSANEDGSASYDGAAQFVNKYVPATGSFSLNLVKTVNGKSENVSGFKFAATSNDEGAPSLGEQETDNQGKASFTFDGLDDSYEGKEFTYTISETSSLGSGWTKAADVVAKVNIGQRGDDNKFHPTVTYGDSGSDTGAKFDNTYEATGSVTLSVAKQVNGANPSSGQSFSYELIPIGSAPMPEGKESLTTSTLGSVASSFDSIPYCLDDAGKKFEYRIHETTPQTVGWTMAGDIIAKVTVGEDNGDGILKPSTVEYVKAENDQVSASVDDQNSAALFNNLYQQASGKFQLGLTKTVNGSAPLKGETFGFAATAIGDNATDAPKLNNVTTDENGEAKFAEATLADKDAGKTYTYRIHEVSDLADDSGAWTKAPDVIATVQVSDRSSSNELAATVSYKQDSNNAESYEGAAAFNNLHADKKAETVLKVSKTVNGAEDKNLQKQFGFQLQPKDGAPMPKSDVVTVTGTTSASFDKIVYDKVGIYNYVIHESSEAGSGWTNADDVEATVEVGYAENGRDLVVKSIKYNNRQTDAATFNNTYEATGSVTLSVAKQVNGKSPLANEKFQFQLAGQDGAPMPAEGTTCETVGSAPAQFGSIPFALADAGKTYIYTITETTQGSSEWKIAGPVTATVTVGKDNGDGTLSAPTVTYSVSGMNGGAALFNNTYETSTQATVNVHKTVTGGTDKVKNESFDFELHKADEQGNMTDEVVGTVSAKADETKSFNPIKYTTSDAGKTFTYWIHEKGHNDKGWTADKDTKVTVKVVENADRSLSAEVSYERGTSAAEFTNAYATSGQATLSVFKTVNGGTEQGAGQKFHFDLYKADDQGNAQGEKVDSVETVVGEKASFGAIDLSGEGTYHYVIKESGYNNGAWFAAGDVIATVTATDNGDGTLKTEVAYSDPDADKSAALFDNVYAPTNASIWVKKTVNGEAAPVDKHFTFELQAQDGAPMPGEATADTFGGDTCSFGDIEFTEEGEYRYVIHETADLGEGWTNAADVPVTVKVVRDEDAKTLKVESISYGNNAYEENGQAMALFDNKYEAPEQPKGDTPKADTPNSEGGQPVASDGAKSSGTKTGDSMILAGGALALVAVAAAGIAAFALRRRK